MNHRTQWIAALLLAGCVCGCEAGLSSDPPSYGAGAGSTSDANRAASGPRVAGLIPQSRPPIPDVPVPIGFKLAEQISRNYESAGARFVDHTYEGHADKFQIERFYANQMPLKGWTLLGRQMVRGTFLMRFEKKDEYCEIRITTESTFTGERTQITVNIQTLGRGDNPAYRNAD